MFEGPRRSPVSAARSTRSSSGCRSEARDARSASRACRVRDRARALSVRGCSRCSSPPASSACWCSRPSRSCARCRSRRSCSARSWTPLFYNKKFGVLPLVGGTLLVSAIAMARRAAGRPAERDLPQRVRASRVRRIVKPALEILAGVPTVVYGYFALLFVTPLLQQLIPALAGFNALSPGHRDGHHDPAARLVAVRRRAARRAERPARGRLRARARRACRRPSGWWCPPRSRASRRPSSWPCRAPIGETMIVAIAAGQQPRLTGEPAACRSRR